MKKLKTFLISILCCVTACGALPFISACNKDDTAEEDAAFDKTPDNQPEPSEKVVYYSEYGAVGDGVTDDFAAICSAHEDANQKGLAVAADKGATYYIGGDDTMKEHIHRKSAIIKTNTYWQDAKFIIDDRGITNGQILYKPVFAVESDTPDAQIEVPYGYKLTKGTANVGLTFDTPVLLYIVNENKEDFIRSGTNHQHVGGYARQEIVLVDKNGNIDESTPLTWDYTEVTSLTTFAVDDKPITISGGQFTTVVNDYKYDLFRRNLQVMRSNTTVKNVDHYMRFELTTKSRSPYAGFFYAQKTANVVFENCRISAHTEMDGSSYELNSMLCNNVLWKNITQTNGSEKFNSNGVHTSNYSRNLKADGCVMLRFDAHCGMYNATLTNCTFDHVNAVGFGTLYYDNVKIKKYTDPEASDTGAHFVYLRDDYGSFWDGEIIIKNSKMDTNCEYIYFVRGSWTDHDYGYTCKLPNLTAENIEVVYTGTLQNKYQKQSYYQAFYRYMKKDVLLDDFYASKNPVTPPEYIRLNNVSCPFKLSSNNQGYFANTQFTIDGVSK